MPKESSQTKEKATRAPARRRAVKKKHENQIDGLHQLDNLQLLASIVSSSDDAIIGKTLDGKITTWNKGSEILYGYKEKEVIGKPVSILIAPDMQDEMPAILKRLAAGGRVDHYETKRLRKDGTIIDVSLTMSPIKDGDGNIIGASTIAHNITPIKKTAARKGTAVADVGNLTRSQEEKLQLLDSIIASSDDAIIGKTLDGTITTWNKGAEQLYGYTEKEIVGKPIATIIAPEHGDEMPTILGRVARGDRVDHYETQRVRKDSSLVDISLTVSPIKNTEGQIIGASTIARDITAQKHAAQYARSLIEASLDPLVTISAEGKITDVNEASVEATGVLREKLIATDFSDYFTEPAKARAGYQQVFAKGSVSDYPLTIRHRDGSLMDVLYNASVYRDTEGNVLGVFAAARDITAQKQAAQYARSLIEASLDPLVTISPDGKITDVNEASVKATGVPKDYLIGTDFSNYFTEPDEASAGYQQVFAKGSVSDYPLTIRHRDGSLMDVLYNASVYKDTSGSVLGVFAAARDITAQKQASQYARSLIEASLDPLVTISPEGKITDVNETSVKATGVPRDNLIGTDFSDYFTEPDEARAGYQQVFAKGSVSDYPLTIRHRDGSLMDVLYNASVYKDTSGSVLGVFAAARDITAQKQAAQYARSLIEASPDPLVTISPEGKITDVNEASVKVTGVPRDNLIGTDFSNYFTEPEKAREGYQQVFAQGSVSDYPLTIRHRNGNLTEVLYNATVYKDTAGNVLGVFAAARDVTAQRQAEKVAQQRSKELVRLAELEQFQKLTVGRELKMIELKREIQELKHRLGEGIDDLLTEGND